MKDSFSTKEFFDRFTKAVDAVKHIEYLENLNLDETDDLTLEKIVDDKFPIFTYTSGRIPEGTELFRARLNVNEKPFPFVNDIWTPPVDRINNYGRANRPGEQIFYCASNFRLAAFEVIQDFKNSLSPKHEVAFLTIGVWKTLKPLHVALIIDSPVLHNIRHDIRDNFEKNQALLNKGHLTNEVVTANNLISQFFSDQFTKSNIKSHNDYKISALYARRLKESSKHIAKEYKSEIFDGINYPSVAMKFKGDNQAIFIDSAKNKLKLINVIQVVCSNLDFDSGNFVAGIMHEAETIDSGNITWKKEIYSPS
jgi:hypothetical protein